MKYRKLFVSGLAFLAAILLIVCGIFIPTALLQAQENRILNSQYARLIDTRELEIGYGNWHRQCRPGISGIALPPADDE